MGGGYLESSRRSSKIDAFTGEPIRERERVGK